MSKLFQVCLDIEGNDRGLTVTTVAADARDEAIDKAQKHVGAMNQNFKQRLVTVLGCKEIGEKGCYSGESIPREWLQKKPPTPAGS